MRELTMSGAICEAMDQEIARDEKVFLLGEDIGFYGGCFKVTKGLFEKYGHKRVMDTPISESAIIGAAAGAALTGLRPIAELMFMDFITVCMDPLVNQAAKARYMSGGEVKVPMVLRLPYGGGMSGAAQHSQSLETWFAHVPGLYVATPSNAYDAKGLMIGAIRNDNPVVYCEHKLLYGSSCEVPEESYEIPLGQAKVVCEGKNVTVVATSIMVQKSLRVAEKLALEGISVEVIDPRTISPLDMDTILKSVKKTNHALIAHEACKFYGFGGEIASQIMENAFDYLDAPVGRVGAKFAPLPYNWDLEREIIPQDQDIEDAIRDLLQGKSNF